MMEGMMQSLLSKELLYPSLKDVADKASDVASSLPARPIMNALAACSRFGTAAFSPCPTFVRLAGTH